MVYDVYVEANRKRGFFVASALRRKNIIGSTNRPVRDESPADASTTSANERGGF